MSDLSANLIGGGAWEIPQQDYLAHYWGWSQNQGNPWLDVIGGLTITPQGNATLDADGLTIVDATAFNSLISESILLTGDYTLALYWKPNHSNRSTDTNFLGGSGTGVEHIMHNSSVGGASLHFKNHGDEYTPISANGVWAPLILTRASGLASLWINGVLGTNQPHAIGDYAWRRFGYSGWKYGELGSLDEIMIWDGVALSAAERASLLLNPNARE